jgi:hypothetical protein
MLTFSLIDAFGSSPGIHISNDATREDQEGQATCLDAFAGPGLSAVKHALAWAFNNDESLGDENLACRQ